MDIQNSTVSFSSQHSYIQQFEARQRNNQLQIQQSSVELHFSSSALQAAEQDQAIEADTENSISDPKMRLLAEMIYAMTGERVNIIDPRDIAKPHAGASEHRPPPSPPGRTLGQEQHSSLYEAEYMKFSAQGTIKTSDGQEIQFELTLEMSREFYQERHISSAAAERKDPLVVNFNGAAAQLGNQQFNFDLDRDGEAEQLPFLNANSGFLVLDQNNNGSIDDGSELFGATTGNGFAELKAYDQDNNNWIDSRDDVYQQLQVWSKDSNGQDQLESLTQRNIAALYLGSINTPFDLKNNQNQQLGQIRETGLYLQDNGQVGTLQQVDFMA